MAMTSPEFEPLPDAFSGEPPTDHECQLFKDAGCGVGVTRHRRAGSRCWTATG
jgi:hypothetical protein